MKKSIWRIFKSASEYLLEKSVVWKEDGFLVVAFGEKPILIIIFDWVASKFFQLTEYYLQNLKTAKLLLCV